MIEADKCITYKNKKKEKKKKLWSLKVENNGFGSVIINILITVVNQHILLMKIAISLISVVHLTHLPAIRL